MTAIKKGFTLIELLIVIAILGVLAVVVLVAINPIEQLAKTRDAGRISTITQLGHSIQAYYTTQNATYPTETAPNWYDTMVTSGELSVMPSGIAYTAYSVAGCSENVSNTTWCYDLTAANGAIVYARLESNANDAKCATAAEIAWVVYSTADGRGGVVCTAAAATGLDPLAAGGFAYR